MGLIKDKDLIERYVKNGENGPLDINSGGTFKLTTNDEDYSGSAIEMTHGSSISPNGQVQITTDNLSVFDGTTARRVLNNGVNTIPWNVSTSSYAFASTDTTNGPSAINLGNGAFGISGGIIAISAGKPVSFQVSGANFSIQTIGVNDIATYNGKEIATKGDIISNTYGSITSGGQPLLLQLEDTGFILHLQYQSANVAYLYGKAESTDVVADIRRASIYGDASQGSTLQNRTFTSDIGTGMSTQYIDDILMDSTDWVTLNVRTGGHLYQVYIWISNAGADADMWYIKIR